jgi:carbonic anhydrase/acetyltransferase-like protein (isoleucine patch superfamily)
MNDAAGRAHPMPCGGLILPYKGALPAIGKDVFVAPTATVIGNVTIGDGSNVWFNVLIRGDDHWIKIGERTNLQDGAVVHLSKDTAPTFIGSDITIGHGAIIHGCTLHDRCMIGIGAIVLDGAIVETGAIVGAGAVVPPGKRVPAGEMWAGCPAKKARDVRPEETGYIDRNAAHYCGLAGEYLKMRRALAPGM